MKTSLAFLQGMRHRSKGTPCQDYADFLQTPFISACAIADGCSEAAYAVEAARINVDEALKFVTDEVNWHADTKEEILNRLLDRIENAFRKSGKPMDELCATLCVAAITKDGDYLLISIGDSTIVAFNEALEPLILVQPYNGATLQNTIFTNDRKHCLNLAEVKCYQLETDHYCFCGFGMYTDGCEKLFSRWIYQGSISLQKAAAHALLEEDSNYTRELIDMIAKQYTSDDVTLAIMLKESDTAIVNARQILEPVQPEKEPEQPEKEPEKEPDLTIDLSEYPVRFHAILRKLAAAPASPKELTSEGYIAEGKILETLAPLLHQGTVVWEDGAFRLTV